MTTSVHFPVSFPRYVRNTQSRQNWGLITYRETDLLAPEGQISLRQRDRVLVVIAHEMAHQWFGNLVTMQWWDDLWLNEGFASFMEYLGSDSVNVFAYQDEDGVDGGRTTTFNEFFVNTQRWALSADAYTSSHALEAVSSAGTNREIDALFDTITYEKGASVRPLPAT